MKDIHILKDVDYASKIGGGTIADVKELDQLAPGAVLVVMNDDTVVLPATVAGDIATATHFSVYVGVDNGSSLNPKKFPYGSKDIPRNVTQLTTKAYAAPTNQVKVIGNDGVTVGASLNLPVTLVPGDLAAFKIIRSEIAQGTSPLGGKVDSMHVASNIMRIEYTIQTGDTVADVLAALVSKVNNHPMNQGADAWIVAASIAANTGLQLTSTVYGQTFDLATDELLRQASIITTVDISYGNGLGTQAAEQELYASSRKGNSSQFHLAKQLYDVQLQADVNETYITWNLVWAKVSDAIVASHGADSVRNEAIFYVPDGASDLADIRAVFNVAVLSGGAV